MRRLRLLAVVAALGGLAALVANPVAAGWSDSGSLEYQIAADDFGEPPDDPGDEGGASGFVWVCKLVGPPGNPHLQSEDPIRVSVHALDENGEFPDAHPSYIVEEGEKCTWPRQSTAETETTSTTEPPTDDQKRGGGPEEGDETAPPDSTTSTSTTSTSTTSTSTTSTTVAPTTTSTTSSTSTTTTVPTSTTAPLPPDDEGA